MAPAPAHPVTGQVDPGFEPVRDAFTHNFSLGREVGAALCVHVGGRTVVDLCGGSFDREGTRPYGPDTLQLVFSSTKGATAACANLLAQRGLLDVDAPVSAYWPEFAQAGKKGVRVRHLLCHQAGLPAIDRDLTAEETWAWDPVVDALSVQEAFWEPGTAHGYHALTYGYLVGEVVRRVTGRSLGRFFAEEIAAPLNLELFIGLPEQLEPRVSPIVGFVGAGPAGTRAATAGDGPTLLTRALNMGNAIRRRDWMNERGWHAAEVPAANAITNARSLSRLYAALIGPVEGGPAASLLTSAQVARARTVLTSGPDQVFASVGFPMRQRIGLGFWRANLFAPFGGEGSFGHAGAGGSYGFADPEHELAVAYVMNRMSEGVVGDPRSRPIVKAVYAAIGNEAKYA